MAHTPTLKQLKYLCAISDARHFGQAAKQCHVSQSTLSAAISELEQLLDASLVERNNKRVLLTALGEEIVGKSRQILTQAEDLVSLCTSSKDFFNGKLRLGVIPTVAPFLLPDVLNEVRAAYPQLTLFIREDLTDRLIDSLQHGDLDLLLLALPYAAEQVETEELFFDEFLLACRENSEFCKTQKVPVAELRDKAVLLLEDGHCLTGHALEACHLKPADIEIPYQATSLTTVVQMVANGVGVTLLPTIALDSNILHGTNLKTRSFAESNVGRTLGMMWRKTSPFGDDYRKLAKLVRNLYQ